MLSETLYEIADLRAIIDLALEESEGELTPEIEAALNAWDERFDDKAERVALYIAEQEGLAEMAKAERKRLDALCAAREKRAASLKRYLFEQMEKAGKVKVAGVLKQITIQNNPPKVEPLVDMDEAELRNVFMFAPQYVQRIPESYALNKRAILDAAKAGTLDEDMKRRVAVVQTKGLRIR